MYQRILVPLDGSDAAEAALALAALIPSRHVRLLTVEPDTKGPMLASAPDREAWNAGQEREGLALLNRAARPLRRRGRSVDTVFAFGDPADRIVRAAAAVDLVVMGSHGRGSGGRFFHGSVADHVARHATAPTMIVRGGEHPTAAPPLTRLVVPLDGSPLAERALPTAAGLADALGLPIHLVRVVDFDPLRATVQAGGQAAAASAEAQESPRHQAEEYLAVETRRLRDRDLTTTSEVSTGPLTAALLDAIRPGDLVVLTTHGRGGIRRWLLGSTAEKLVRLASAPVLLVRAEQASDG